MDIYVVCSCDQGLYDVKYFFVYDSISRDYFCICLFFVGVWDLFVFCFNIRWYFFRFVVEIKVIEYLKISSNSLFIFFFVFGVVICSDNGRYNGVDINLKFFRI